MSVSVENRRNRLRSTTAAVLTVLLLVPLGLLFARYWDSTTDRRDQTATERQGVEYLTRLIPLMTVLTELQGSAVQGSKTTPTGLQDAVNGVAEVDQRLGAALGTRERWADLRERVDALPRAAGALPVVLSAHIVAGDLMLGLFDAVRDNSRLLRDPDNDLSHLQQAVAADLPQATTQASRMADLSVLLTDAGAAQRLELTPGFGAAAQAVDASVDELTENLGVAVTGTSSRTLSGNLITPLDAFRRGIETLTRDVNPTGKPNRTALTVSRAQLRQTLGPLSSTLLREMDGLLQQRLDDVDADRREAVMIAVAAGLIALLSLAMIIGPVVRRRRTTPPLDDGKRDGDRAGNAVAVPVHGNSLHDPVPHVGSEVPRPGGSNSVLFGKFRILGKLTLLVLVPLLGVVALSVPLAANRVAAARAAGDAADVVAVAGRVSTALQALQEERLLSVGYLFGLVDASKLVTQTTTVKDRLARVNDLGEQLSPALRQAIGWAGGLQRTRAAVLAGQTRPDQVVDDFTNVVTPIIDALDLATEADLTTPTGRQIFALDQALRSDDMISQASSLLTSAVATKQAGFISLFSTKLVELQSIVIRAEPFFTDQQYRLYLLAQSSFLARLGNNFFTLSRTNPAAAINLLDLRRLYPSMLSAIVLGGFVEKRIASDVDAAVTTSRRDATRQAYLIVGLTLALLLLVIGLSVMMARAVARPLRRLTSSAERIALTAESELERVADDDVESARPVRLDPVDVQADDEIGDLARAFDRVQSTAARLVERQVAGRRNVAQMFGHVGRRTQNLVGRQLALIDSLERRETDSDRLRELYRLDHMSSRLRRNASSLVVLSGGAGADDHMAPMPLSDVVRLALGEIEDYTRVDVEVPEDMVARPAVVADLTLLLAELMENATAFSPPHTRVTVTAAEAGAGARLSVVDHGLGLPAERMAEENARLTTRERLDLAPSEVLGLFVVGRLARRHGLSVSLADTPEGA